MAAQFIEDILLVAKKYKVLMLCAPDYVNRKQLIDLVFPSYDYIDMSILKNRMYFNDEPLSLMHNFNHKLILDNIQYCPNLLKFISSNLESIKNGQIILSVNYKIYQTNYWSDELAKNVWILERPIIPAKVFFELGGSLEHPIDSILTSNIPALSRDVSRAYDYYVNFLDNLIKTSLHLVHHISDPLKVALLLRSLAARIGRNCDLKELAETCDLTVPTVRKWLKLLELFYIIYPVYPYPNNYGKRINKSVTYQFYNTGVACMLLNIRSQQDYVASIFRKELVKCICAGIVIVSVGRPNVGSTIAYYWKESYGHRVDLLIGTKKGLSGYIFTDSLNPSERYYDELLRFAKISNTPIENFSLVYPGQKSIVRNKVQLISWKDIA